MNLEQLKPILEEIAPLAYAEDFDNVGFLTYHENKISGILVCHDALENVIDEALEKKCNVVVCFHPIWFSGLKKLTGKNYVERSLLKAIKNDIAIYAIHTALDNHKMGVNKIFANALGLTQTKILIPKKHFIQKLVTYVPAESAEKVRKSLFEAGAGNIGNYSEASFNTLGKGTFKGNEYSNPVIGTQNVFETVEELKIEVVFEKHLQPKILKTLFETHPYEEVAYELYATENLHQDIGLGILGEFETALSESAFLELVKEKMICGGIRHSALLSKSIKKVALLGGSGSFAIQNALNAQVDAFITSDLKYHNYFEAEGKMVLLDIGHFESERWTKNYIVDFLKEKITTFAIILSEVNTNPVQYY